MARRRLARMLFAAAAGAGGCQTPPKPPPVPVEVARRPWVDAAVPPGTYTDPDRYGIAALAALPVPAAKPRSVLAVSAGGKYGAYAAGLLAGWTDRGDRPEFDIATGVSSGALIATFAFLGPKYDAAMVAEFTDLKDEDLFRVRPVRELLRHGAIATADPLRGRIERGVNEATLADLRAAHAAGRRLFVATFNPRTKKMVTWDLTAVAAPGTPEAGDLVRKILLACCAIPGLVPPVELQVEIAGRAYTEQHADGGVVAQAFVRFGPEFGPPQGQWLAGTTVYVLTCGKIDSDPIAGKMNLLSRVSSAFSASLYALYRAELFRIYGVTQAGGGAFKLHAIPQDYPLLPGSLKVPPEEMNKLVAAGRARGLAGVPWRTTPPGGEPGEGDVPRAGLRGR